MVNSMSMHSYIVTNLWVNVSLDATEFPHHILQLVMRHPHPTPFICLTADDPPVLFSPTHQPTCIC